MTAMARLRGHEAAYRDGAWRTLDGAIADPMADCSHCGQPPTLEGHDACLGTLPGVVAACCGHGRPEDAYFLPPESGDCRCGHAKGDHVRAGDCRLCFGRCSASVLPPGDPR